MSQGYKQLHVGASMSSDMLTDSLCRTDMSDVPLLRAITETFGASMWFNTIVALTHAAAAPPDGNNGPLSYDTYTRTRTQLLQQNIR